MSFIFLAVAVTIYLQILSTTIPEYLSDSRYTNLWFFLPQVLDFLSYSYLHRSLLLFTSNFGFLSGSLYTDLWFVYYKFWISNRLVLHRFVGLCYWFFPNVRFGRSELRYGLIQCGVYYFSLWKRKCGVKNRWFGAVSAAGLGQFCGWSWVVTTVWGLVQILLCGVVGLCRSVVDLTQQ